MTRRTAILNLILQLGRSWYDQRHEPFDEWQVRADTIAEAIDVTTRGGERANEDAAFLTYMAWHEGKNSKWVQRGLCLRHRGKLYWSLWQIEHSAVKEWSNLIIDGIRLDVTTYAAGLGLDLYRRHRGTGTLIDGIRGYGGYKRWSPTPRILAARIRKIERKLDELTNEGVP